LIYWSTRVADVLVQSPVLPAATFSPTVLI
jgi:hypothetical protein